MINFYRRYLKANIRKSEFKKTLVDLIDIKYTNGSKIAQNMQNLKIQIEKDEKSLANSNLNETEKKTLQRSIKSKNLLLANLGSKLFLKSEKRKTKV